MDDRELLIRTVLGEAGNQEPAGMAAVVHNVLNRVGDPEFGGSIHDVALKPNAYEANTPPSKMMRFSPNSESWRRAESVVDSVLSGKAPDPTNGAVHFYQPDLQRSLGRSVPSWAKGPSVQVGAHVFNDFRNDKGGDPTDLLGQWKKEEEQAAPEQIPDHFDVLGQWTKTAPAHQDVSNAPDAGPTMNIGQYEPTGQAKFNRMMDFISHNPTHPYSMAMSTLIPAAGAAGMAEGAAPAAAWAGRASAPMLKSLLKGGAKTVGEGLRSGIKWSIGAATAATGAKVLDDLTGGYASSTLERIIHHALQEH